jgi:hypothetical protein
MKQEELGALDYQSAIQDSHISDVHTQHEGHVHKVVIFL